MTAIAIPARQRHVLAFGKPLGLTDEQIDATVVGDSGDPAWSDRDARVTGKRRPAQEGEGEGE
jgi:hypothetical protein